MSSKDSNNKFIQFCRNIKNAILLRPLFAHNSLETLDVGQFVNIFYPIGLSLVLAVAVTELANGRQDLSLTITSFTAPIIVVLLVVYSLLDWDDCHHIIALDVNRTSYDKILWLLSIFLVALTSVLFIKGQCGFALNVWLAYSILAIRFRDQILEMVSTNANVIKKQSQQQSNDKTKTVHLTEWDLYKEVYLVKRNFVIFIFIILLCLGILSSTERYNPLRFLAKPPDKDNITIAIHLVFIICGALALWLKNYRKIKLLVEARHRLVSKTETVLST